jgi:hypothetical protein
MPFPIEAATISVYAAVKFLFSDALLDDDTVSNKQKFEDNMDAYERSKLVGNQKQILLNAFQLIQSPTDELKNAFDKLSNANSAIFPTQDAMKEFLIVADNYPEMQVAILQQPNLSSITSSQSMALMKQFDLEKENPPKPPLSELK